MKKENGCSILAGIFGFLFLTGYLSATSLSEAIHRAPPGSRIVLPAGVFRGPLLIDKSLIIQGSGEQTVIDGGEKGSVLTVHASRVWIRNLTIRRSGRRREKMDAAIRIDGSLDVTVEGCRIQKTLFGIIAERSRKIQLRHNTIDSYPEKVVDNRGDAIRLWGVTGAEISKNSLERVRDLAVLRSRNIRIFSNRVIESRYGILAVMDRNVSVSGNTLVKNYAGILVKGGKNLSIDNNLVARSRLSTATGILLAGGAKIRLRHNRIIGCTQGLYIDTGNSERGMRRIITENSFVANTSAMHFHAVIRNNTIRKNLFRGNLEDVTVDLKKNLRRDNNISGNYWDRYEGFDRDKDGFGDTPYRVLIYADKLWEYDHHLRWFYATPLMSLLDFIERIAPFDEPDLLFVDPHPRMQPPSCVKKD